MLKWLSIALLAIVLLIAAWLAYRLGPAHVQIRGIDEELPDAAVLLDDAWLTAAGGPVAMTWINTATQTVPGGAIGHVAFVARWADGRAFLIDTGMNETDAIAFGKTLETLMGAGPTETFGPVETQMGGAIDDVRGIAFTHLHSDHTVGITAICGALRKPAVVYQTARQATSQNFLTEAGQQLVRDSKCPRETLADALVKPVPGFPGLVAIAAGGHTPGSTIYAARVAGKTWVFAGDLTNVKADVPANRGKGFLYSYLFVPENTAQLARWRVWLAGIDARPDAEVVISHDIGAIRGSALRAWPG